MLVYLKLLLTAAFWGGTFIAGRAVAKNLDPFSAALLRFTLASVFLLLLTLKVEGRFPRMKREQVIPIVLLGIAGICAYHIFFFAGLKIIDAGRAALIVATTPIFITIFSWFFFREKLNLAKVIGIITSVIGVTIVISRGNLVEILDGNIGWGELCIFGCVLSWTTYSLIGKAMMAEVSPLVLITYSSVIGTIGLFIPAYFNGVLWNLGNYSTMDWLCIFYLAIFGTVIGLVWYYEGIKNIGPVKAGLFINFVPIFAIVLAFFILGEPITISLLIGAILVIFGVYLVNRTYAGSKI